MITLNKFSVKNLWPSFDEDLLWSYKQTLIDSEFSDFIFLVLPCYLKLLSVISLDTKYKFKIDIKVIIENKIFWVKKFTICKLKPSKNQFWSRIQNNFLLLIVSYFCIKEILFSLKIIVNLPYDTFLCYLMPKKNLYLRIWLTMQRFLGHFSSKFYIFTAQT